MRINLEFELKYCVAVTNKNRPAAVISWYEKLIRLTSTFQSCYNKMLISRWQPSYHLPLSPMWGRFTHDAAFQSSIASLEWRRCGSLSLWLFVAGAIALLISNQAGTDIPIIPICIEATRDWGGAISENIQWFIDWIYILHFGNFRMSRWKFIANLKYGVNNQAW